MTKGAPSVRLDLIRLFVMKRVFETRGQADGSAMNHDVELRRRGTVQYMLRGVL